MGAREKGRRGGALGGKEGRKKEGRKKAVTEFYFLRLLRRNDESITD